MPPVRENVSLDIGDAKLAGDRLGRSAIVACQHEDADLLRAQRIQGGLRGRFDRAGNGDNAGRLAIHCDEERRGARAAQFVGRSAEIRQGGVLRFTLNDDELREYAAELKKLSSVVDTLMDDTDDAEMRDIDETDHAPEEAGDADPQVGAP